MTTVSMGIAVYPDDTLDSETLLKYADMALYRAKEGGKNNYHYYSPAIQAKVIERLELEGSLRTALHQERLFLNYQPIVSLRTGQIVGMETLLRLRDTEGRTFVPAQFVPVAEETGMIVPIGEWVLRVSCAQNKAWQEMGLPEMVMAVNLSAVQLQEANFVSLITRVLHRTGLAPRCLELELTESMMRDTEHTLRVLRSLRDIGVLASIDDFGTGYSSLSHLRQFPFNTLKIDISFIRNMVSNEDDRRLVETIITMAHNLRLQTIAEGVETAEQLQALRSLGCDSAQGFFISKPLSADEVTARLFEKNAFF